MQFLYSFIKRDKKFFKRRFGVQFFLDIIRKYLLTIDITNSEATKAVRTAIMGIINYYIQKEVNVQEVNAIISYVVLCQACFQVINNLLRGNLCLILKV